MDTDQRETTTVLLSLARVKLLARATGRVCVVCGTVLSRYNGSGTRCFAHDRQDDLRP